MTKKSGPTREKRAKGRKLVVDLENGKREVEVSDLTEDDTRVSRRQISGQMTAFARRWKAKGDPAALAGALSFCAPQLPKWVFKALWHILELQLQGADVRRYLAVHHAHDVLGKTMDEAYEWAEENVTGPAAGGRDTMMKSYQKIRPQVPPSWRIQPRPRKGRRS